MSRRAGRIFDPRRIVCLTPLLVAGLLLPPLHAQNSLELDVLVPSSLGSVVEQITTSWADAAQVEVRVTVDATSRLVSQAERGAPVDLLITADRAWMDRALAEGVVADARVVARNRLVLVAAAGGQSAPDASVRSTLLGGRIGVALEEVPAGRYARQALHSLDVVPELVSGGSVRTAFEWAARGELPLGIVYASDARGDSRVDVVHEFDPSLHEPIEYWAALAPDAPEEARVLLNHLSVELDGDQPPVAAQPRGPSLGSALSISMVVALFAVLFGTVPAIGVGRVLATRAVPGRSLISGILLAPLVIPPVVTGFLLLSFFGAGGPLGGLLGGALTFTPLAAIVAATAVGIPLYAVVARRAFESVDRRYEELSWTLGEPPRSTFRRVALPLALPGILAGAVLAFARALGEFGATIVVAGNIEGETRTLALAVYTLLEQPGAAGQIWFFVGASVVLSLFALVLYEKLLDRQRVVMEGGRIG